MSGKAKARKTFGKKIKDQSDGLSDLYSLQGKGTVMASTKSAVTGSINNTEVSGQFMQVATTDLNMKTYDIIDVDRLKFASKSMETSDPLTSTDYGMEALYSVVNGVQTAYGLSVRVPASKNINFYRGNDQPITITGTNVQFGDDLAVTGYFDFSAISTPSDPNTTTRRLFTDSTNSNHLSVRTGSGATVDLESSTAGADVKLSNLVANTEVNEHLLPNASGNRNLGSTSKEWATLYLSSGLFFGAGQNSSTLNHSSGLLFNIADDNDWYQFNIDNDRKMSITDTKTIIDGDLEPDTDDVRDLGSSTIAWHDLWIKWIKGINHIDFTTTNTGFTDASGTLQHNANAGHTFTVANTSRMAIGSDYLLIQSSSTPSTLANGMIWTESNGNIYARTGSSTKNLSDIGSGGGGGWNGNATTDLDMNGNDIDMDGGDIDMDNGNIIDANLITGATTISGTNGVFTSLSSNGTASFNSTVNLGDNSSDDINLKGKLDVKNNYTVYYMTTPSAIQGYIDVTVNNTAYKIPFF
tara:strand:- start:8013 stop:9587 length:1575 start_codon:yes stop_codon:yes gene_type:complete